MSLRLAIAAHHTLDLDPKILFIPTGVEVQPGERYQLTALGKWKDSRTVCDAKGWTCPGIGWLRRYNRLPHANWFTLIACVGQTENTARLIGIAGELSITEQDCQLANSVPAQLYVFANDWPSKYSNNEMASQAEGGPMRLTIARLA